MGEKEGLNEKIKQQAATIDQLTRHVNILRSQTQVNEVSRQEDSIVHEFVKTHPSFHFTRAGAGAGAGAGAVHSKQQTPSMSQHQQQQFSTSYYYQPSYTQQKQQQAQHNMHETSLSHTINNLVTPSQTDLRPWLDNSMII